ncbi:MAG: dTDP-4-dehydrorhamnose reductase [Actinobacteria bacterium]|nr:dTDP-4-dehydrorhamnose reductase [Actinomycetota bacterium]
MRLTSVLITGGGGQLASDLEERLTAHSVRVHAPSRLELDVTDDAAVRAALDESGAGIVFNCAAFHNLDICEQDEDRSFEVNARAVKRLAVRCTESGTKLVHMSTNYVFDGSAPEPYGEDDLPRPRSIYAISKLAGEHCALAYANDALVVRTGGLYGLHGSASKGGNFISRLLRRAADQGEVKMVADQRLSPTYTADLANALIEAVETEASGLLHLTAAGECSWYEFARAILDFAGVDVPVEPTETVIPPGGVDRPLNGVLRNGRAEMLGLAPLRPWDEALADYMRAAELSAARAG